MKYVTDGTLLQEILADPLLSQYSGASPHRVLDVFLFPISPIIRLVYYKVSNLEFTNQFLRSPLFLSFWFVSQKGWVGSASVPPFSKSLSLRHFNLRSLMVSLRQ